MDITDNENLTYANFRIIEIRRKLLEINEEIKVNDIDIMNVALALFSILCDAHANNEIGRHEIIEEMLDTKSDFVYYVNDLVKQTSDTNHALKQYIEIELSKK